MSTQRHVSICMGILAMAVCTMTSAADRGVDWLKGKCPNGALAWDYGGAKLIELSNGTTKNLGGGGSVEFSTGGSFLAWNSSGKAMVYARKSGQTREIASGISGIVSWVSDREIVVHAGGWKLIDVITKKVSTPEGLSAVQSGSIADDGDLKMTREGKWVVIFGDKIRSNSPDAKVGATIPGDCSGSLSPEGKSMTGLQHDHLTCKYTPARSGGASGQVSWKVSCSGKGMDNNRFSSTSPNWIVFQNECASAMVVIEVSSNDYAMLGSSGKTSSEDYGDFSHIGPALDFGSTAVEPLRSSTANESLENMLGTNRGQFISAAPGYRVAVYKVNGSRLEPNSRNLSAGIRIVKLQSASEVLTRSLVTR